MTFAEMESLYKRATGRSLHGEHFTVRQWDGSDGCWCDGVKNVDLEAALTYWCERTSNGTQRTKFSDFDYYAIFPADTNMLYSGTNPMLRGGGE